MFAQVGNLIDIEVADVAQVEAGLKIEVEV